MAIYNHIINVIQLLLRGGSTQCLGFRKLRGNLRCGGVAQFWEVASMLSDRVIKDFSVPSANSVGVTDLGLYQRRNPQGMLLKHGT